MDLERVREFRALAKTLNFTQTARSLNVSVSTLSKHIQALENEIGVSLIERSLSGGPGTLTTAGRVFLNETGPWLEEYDAIVERCQALREPNPPARVHGVTASISDVTAQISHLMGNQGRPRVRVACVGTTLPTREALDKGATDFAYYFEPVPRVRWIENDEALQQTYGCLPLAPERLFAVVGAGNAACKEGLMTLARIERSRNLLMSNALYNNWLNSNEELFLQRGCRLSSVIAGDMPLLGDAFPLGSHDITIVPMKFADYYRGLDVEDVSVLDIEGEPILIYSFLIYRKDTESAAVREIVRAFEARKAEGNT